MTPRKPSTKKPKVLVAIPPGLKTMPIFYRYKGRNFVQFEKQSLTGTTAELPAGAKLFSLLEPGK